MLLLENKDFREFIALLNSNAVRFLIVGGHAVTFHGAPRFTADLDLWVATDWKNAGRVNQALTEFGFGNLFDADDFSRPGYAIQLGRPPYRIDILTSIQGIDFAPPYARRKTLKADGLELPFIGLNELLANKRAVGRLHDLDDAAKLAAGHRPKANKPQPARAAKPKKAK
jgi:predicted nucleotidyltransferase